MEGESAQTLERRIAELRSYEDLATAIAGVVAARQISLNELDQLSGLQPGYNGKCLGQARVKKYGPMSMWVVLQTLGVRLVMIEDEEALAAMRERYTKKDAQQSRPQNHASPAGMHMKRRVFGQFSKQGGRARWKKMNKSERTEHQRRAANARWIAVRRRRRKAARARRKRVPASPPPGGRPFRRRNSVAPGAS